MGKGTLLVFACAATALVAAAPSSAEVGAQPYAASVAATRKSEALLGTGSRLAALLARQQGEASPVVPAVANLSPAALPAARLQTSSLHPVPSARPTAAFTDAPDLFGSVALAVAATPLDRRWKAVARRPADAALSRWAASLRNRPEAERLDIVNRLVNQRIAFADDIRQFGRGDVWQSAADSLRRGRGDCEDYAIAKLQLLRAAGLAERDLYLVILKDLARRSDHAVLAVRSGGRLWVLDNGSDRVTDSADIADYRPIFTYAAGRRWTHGYRRSAEPPMVLASATTADFSVPVPAAAPRADNAPEPRFTVEAGDLLRSLID